jgi:peroxiredoxin
MKKLIALFAVTLTLTAAGQFSNRRAPGFSLSDSHYRQHDPQDYRGKVLLVDIMQTTCQVCTKLVDVLVQLKAKYGEQLGIISVVTLPDNFGTTDVFTAAHKLSWPLVFDSGQMIASYLQVTPSNPQVHFPHLFVIDKNGMIKNDFEGTDDKFLTLDALSAEIDKLK